MKKKLLITGGTGSFGNAVLKRYLNTDFVDEIRIFSRDEKKQDDMRKFYQSDKIKYYLGCVRDIKSVEYAMRGVDYVFHAAALKQVPSCEFFPIEAVKTNVMGLENVITAALNNQVKRIIYLSTDKAVYPINAMGMSKAIAEKVMIAHARQLVNNETILSGTRYGNVMASRGSVIPLFIEQIKLGKPLTITNPKMTRFMMTLEDAVELVIYAFDNGHQGDIFVQKAPATSIEILAGALIELYNSKTDIRIIGTRHGEKLYESLLNKEEFVKAIDEGNYYRILADNRDLNYENFFTKGVEKFSQNDEYTSHNTTQLNIEETKKLLMKLPEVRKDILGEDTGQIFEL